MNGIIHFETFVLTGILLNITPGNDTIYILTKSIGEGKKAGIVSALGIGTGCLVHTILAAFGLSVIVSKSILLFSIIKYAGALYLLYMGYKMLTAKGTLTMTDQGIAGEINYLRIYREGIVTNVLNPKVALFFIAFLPQFISTTAGDSVLPFLLLGTTFIVTGTIWCLMLAVFASLIISRIKRNHRMSEYIHRVCGLALIGLGIRVAFTKME